MPLLVLLLLCLPWPSVLDEEENLEQAGELIRAYRNLPDSAVDRKKNLLDRLHALQTDEAVRFVAHEMEKAGDEAIRGHAFLLWADGLSPAAIGEYLDSRKNRPGFRALIPLLPRLSDYDSFTYLKELYEDEGFLHFRNDAAAALAASDSEEAFVFLEEKWKACSDTREGLLLLAALFSFTKGQSYAFLLGLLDSSHPFARLEGMRKILAAGGEAGLIRAGRLLEKENHPVVRAGVLRALAGTGSSGAAGIVARASSSHSPLLLHEIVAALASMPPDAVSAAFPGDLHLAEDMLLFQVGALALSSGDDKGVDRHDKELVRALKRGERDKDPTVSFVAAVALTRLEKKNSKVRRLMTQGRLDTRWDVFHTVECFRIRDAEVADKVVATLGSKAWEMRIKAAQVAAALELDKALPLLEKNILSKRLLVRIAVFKALARIGSRKSVGLMVARLPKEKGRAAWEINRSLKRLTGRDFGIDSKKWTGWWEAEGDSFVPGEKRARGDEVWFEGKPTDARYSFYGLPFDSHNISFVIDLSSSMGAEFHSGPLGESPIAKLRKELAASIKMLSGQHSMNMIFFNSLVSRWQERLVSLEENDGGYKAEALLYARYLRTRGGTNLYGGLNAAMNDEEVDAILLLSDGDPTEGAIIDKDAIVEAVAHRNRVLQAVIHVVAIGRADRAFLRQLALSSGGTFRSL